MEGGALVGFPRGWFVVCFSEDIATGGVRRLKYFGQEMVAFRGQDGAVRVLDAYCPHLGAHLGVGGRVVENSIQCPFHGWRFGPDGACVVVPYAKKIPPRACVRAWPVAERNGVVLVHHDPAGGPPDYEIPLIPELGSDEWLPWSRTFYHIQTHPREIVENIADRQHFPAVHKTEIDEFRYEVDGHICRQLTRGHAFLASGGTDRFASTATYYGPGYLLTRFDGALQNYMLFAHTPVEANAVDLWFAVSLKIVGDRKTTERFVTQYIANLRSGFEDDKMIWEHKIYRERPQLAESEGAIAQLRRWYRQFYEPATTAAPAAAQPAQGA